MEFGLGHCVLVGIKECHVETSLALVEATLAWSWLRGVALLYCGPPNAHDQDIQVPPKEHVGLNLKLLQTWDSFLKVLAVIEIPAWGLYRNKILTYLDLRK